MRRIPVLVGVVLICLLSSRAEAVTFRDVIELTRAGLGEEVLLALIEVDRSVFPIDAASIKRLKDEGVSERVILAMVRSGREVQPPAEQVPVEAAPPVAPEPQVVVIEHREPAEIREVPVVVPIYVPVVTRPNRSVSVHDGNQLHGATELSFGQTVPTTIHGTSVKQPEPVYWGWGGKLRPDAWGQPTQTTTDKKKQN